MIFHCQFQLSSRTLGRRQFFVVDDVDVPMEAYVMAVLRGGCLLSVSVLKGTEGLKIQYSQQKFRGTVPKVAFNVLLRRFQVLRASFDPNFTLGCVRKVLGQPFAWKMSSETQFA